MNTFRCGHSRLPARIRFLLIVAALGTVATAWGEIPRLEGQGFVETVFSEVEMGGVYLLGFVHGEAYQLVNSRELYVWLPEIGAATLCVTIRSIDGLYTATDQFVVQGRAAGIYVLTYGAKEQEVVGQYGPGELVLDGRVGVDCGRPEELTHVPMAWNSDALEDRVAFFINDDGYSGALFFPLKSDSDKIRKVDCVDITSDRPRRVFSAVCVLEDLEDLAMAEGWIEIRGYGRRMDWESLSVAIPSEEKP